MVSLCFIFAPGQKDTFQGAPSTSLPRQALPNLAAERYPCPRVAEIGEPIASQKRSDVSMS